MMKGLRKFSLKAHIVNVLEEAGPKRVVIKAPLRPETIVVDHIEGTGTEVNRQKVGPLAHIPFAKAVVPPLTIVNDIRGGGSRGPVRLGLVTNMMQVLGGNMIS